MVGTFDNEPEEFPPLDSYPCVKAPARGPDEGDAASFAVSRLGLKPDEKQMEVLRSSAKRGILNCSRQWGKSTMGAAKAVHRAYTRPKSLVLVASPSERQSAEFLKKTEELVRELGIQPRGDGANAISILMPNDSRIVGLPGTEAKVRGFSAVSMMLIDEAARVPDDLYQSLRPMIGVGGGELWLMSTPWGQRGFFYETWVNGDPRWFRMSVKATECPWLEADFVEEERREKTADWFAQEYMCEFTTNDEMLFDRDLVEAAFDDTLGELDLGRR